MLNTKELRIERRVLQQALQEALGRFVLSNLAIEPKLVDAVLTGESEGDGKGPFLRSKS